MMTQKELDERWFSFQSIDGVKFGLNDSVSIINEEHRGKFGSVIALTSTQPVTYLVELATGDDINLNENELLPLD